LLELDAELLAAAEALLVPDAELGGLLEAPLVAPVAEVGADVPVEPVAVKVAD
jgi:hypothetical protein